MTWLIMNWKYLGVLIMCLAIVGFAAVGSRYKEKYTVAQAQADQRQETINDMQRRQKSVAALDAQYTKELADAKATINQLHDDVSAGRRRLQLNATCPKQSTAAPGKLGDAGAATITADAERDYWRLRDGISTVTKQVKYLQQYIREQCLK
ncbi:lysis protein [Izhakiella australiensis]|uniref:lysis protein n=1 Tax=Izhakiella australiensis TaxID=1926881 RepID=UPI00098F4FF6|nr:lysis protein [Izhakiella australiensis]